MENEVMQTGNSKLPKLEPHRTWIFASRILLVMVVGLAGSSFAQKSGTKTFSSAAEAVRALDDAAQSNDEPRLEAILGAGKDVTSSSDEVEDKLERERFSQKYQEMHRLVQEPDGTTVLYIGAENWPFPVPLVSRNGVWYFDSNTGKQEIVFRRVGENESTAVEVCHALVTDKQSATSAAENDEIHEYADDLLNAGAPNPGNAVDSRPFHGYYFRVVNGKSAGKSAVLKPRDLVVVAYPAEYRSSGVMTFIVTEDGVVREKDLGKNTAKLAMDPKAITANSGWHAAD
jgi:hypothetical protein